MIVLTAPTGNIGSKVLDRLLAAGQAVRVIARHPSKLPNDVRARVEVIEGSHGDRDTVMRGFEGADAVFWLVASNPAAPSADASYVDFSRPACEAFRECGVKQVVGISSTGRGWPRDAGFVSATLRVDDLIADTGVAYRALAVGSLMENILRQSSLIRDRGTFSWPAPGHSSVPAVASQDVADVAATLLLDRSWTGVESIPVKGPEDISYDEMARTMSEVLGKPIAYREMSLDDMAAAQLARGSSPGMAGAMINMLTAQNEGLGDLDIRPTPNNCPTTFRVWCERVLRPALS